MATGDATRASAGAFDPTSHGPWPRWRVHASARASTTGEGHRPSNGSFGRPGSVALKSGTDTATGRRIHAPAGFGLEALMGLEYHQLPRRLEGATATRPCEFAVVYRDHLRTALRLQAEEAAAKHSKVALRLGTY